MRSDSLVSPHAEPWGQELVDLELLNADATRAISDALVDLRARAHAGHPGATPPALVALGPAGVGKTHLFARLRRKLGPRAVLVHVRPLIGAEMTPRFLLGQILQQLGYESYGLRQIDVLAGVALAVATGDNGKFPAACLQLLRELPRDARRARIEQATATLLDRHPEIDAGYLERLLHVPFATTLQRSAALLWLGGRELDEAQAARLGVREPLADAAVLPALRTLALVASVSAPLLVVFDQLENLVDPDGSAGRVVAYGNLIAELVDAVRDLVIVQMGLSSEWDQHVEPKLGLAQRSRVCGRRLQLELPDTQQRRELLKLWISRIPDPERPFPWPFTEGQLEAVCDGVGATPRMLLLDLRRALDGELPAASRASQPPPAAATPEDLDAPIAAAWERELAGARKVLDENARAGLGPEPAWLFDGLICLGTLVGGIGALKAGTQGLTRTGAGVRTVALVHQPNASSVRAAFRRLSASDGELLAIRERWRDWPPTWKATRADWVAFCRKPGLRWCWLERDDAARLLALASLLKDTRSGDLAGADGRPIQLPLVEAWVRRSLEPAGWGIARAVLGEVEGEDICAEATEPPPEPSGVRPEVPPGALQLVRALRVASLERVMRELARRPGGAARAAVLAELRTSPAVQWVGETIVCWTE